MEHYNLDVVVTRGDSVESRHRVLGAAVDSRGRLIGSAGDVTEVTYWRSCAKPFQVMPLIESGGFDELPWGIEELALASASHGGEPEHVAVAESMLQDIGREEGDLVCGPHEPLSTRGARLVRETGIRLTRLHNNCSGKHAAMMALAHSEDWPMRGYERPEHPVQQAAAESVARWTGVPAPKLVRAVDGCGVVVFGMPLEAMARAYARLGEAYRRCDEVPRRIVDAVRARPLLFGGTDRFDTVLLEETDGRIIAKIGAEGVHSATVLDAGIGVVVKVADGASRAQFPALLRLLQHVGALPESLPPRLAEILHRPVRNTRGEHVGIVGPEA
jgi:L-asparaginase II